MITEFTKKIYPGSFIYRNDIVSARQKLAVEFDRLGSPPFSPEDEAKWKYHKDKFTTAIVSVNCKVNKYNLVVPLFTKQLVPYGANRETDKVLRAYKDLLPTDHNSSGETPIMDAYLRQSQEGRSLLSMDEWRKVWRQIVQVFR